MTLSGATATDDLSPRTGWTSRRWAPVVMAVAVVVLVAAPARVWLHAAVVSVGDPSVPGALRGLWALLGLLPVTVGAVAWLVLRSRPAGRRFVLAALWACPVGALTMVPITPYLVAF